MSANEIGEALGFTANTVIKVLKKLGIKTRSIKESHTERVRLKSERTQMERYGFKHNMLRDNPSRKKWELRLLEEEGITNVFQRDDVKEKIKSSMLEKYGVESSGHLARGRMSSLTKPHLKVIKILNNADVDFGIEFKIDNPKRQYYAYDIILSGTNRIIEIYGDYWHGNPRLYLHDDLILKGSSGEMMVSDKWKYDARKNKHAKDNGYEILVIWEFDLNNEEELTAKRIIDYANGQDRKDN
jgi:G:T-mismatch repair DNA endonuclease (very short patch repair protein)